MRWWRIGLIVIVGVAVSLLMLGVGAYDYYAYRVGTPTTVTIEQCTRAPKGSDESCTGTWSIGGKSYTGPIASGGAGYPQGSSLDVHVHGGTAYTADAASTNLVAGTAVAVLTLGLTALIVLVVWWLTRIGRKSAGGTAGDQPPSPSGNAERA